MGTLVEGVAPVPQKSSISPVQGPSDGGSARSGLSQVDKGAGVVGHALERITGAVGEDNGSVAPGIGFDYNDEPDTLKKGGSIKKYATGGRIKSSISTSTKNKSCPNW